MQYSEMTPAQRGALLDDPDVYPLRVTFLGKAAILTREEIAFLRQNGVDFDVDQNQADRILVEAAHRDVAVLWSAPADEAPEGAGAPPSATRGLFVVIAAVLGGAYALLRLAARFLRRG